MASADRTSERTTKTTDDERGVLATNDDPTDPATLAANESALAHALDDASIPPQALGDLRIGDRIHVNDDPTTYTVQFTHGGILSGNPDVVHLTRDRDGKRFALTVQSTNVPDFHVAVQLVAPTIVRAGELIESESVETVGSLSRIGRGDASRGPGRSVGILIPSDRTQGPPASVKSSRRDGGVKRGNGEKRATEGM